MTSSTSPTETINGNTDNFEVVGDFFLFYLVTSLSAYNASVPTLIKLLLQLFIRDTPVETSLKRQVSDLKEELGSINMTDEFAKYSKIQRKLNKATDELRNKNNRQFIYLTKTRWILNLIFYGLSVMAYLMVNWRYRTEPILSLPSHLFYPLGPLLAFPTGQSDCLSVVVWCFISGYVFRNLIRIVS